MSKNTLQVASDREWFSYLQWHDELTPREIAAHAFAAGARWNMLTTSKLTPYIAQFTEILILLGIYDDGENAALENERNSPLWHTTGVGTPGYQTEPPY